MTLWQYDMDAMRATEPILSTWWLNQMLGVDNSCFDIEHANKGGWTPRGVRQDGLLKPFLFKLICWKLKMRCLANKFGDVCGTNTKVVLSRRGRDVSEERGKKVQPDSASAINVTTAPGGVPRSVCWRLCERFKSALLIYHDGDYKTLLKLSSPRGIPLWYYVLNRWTK